MYTAYRTVASDAEHEITIQKSRFIAHVKRVRTEDEAQKFIEAVNKQHWKANHNCFAYMITTDNLIQKASDDGEPAGTAGVPMLEVLKKKHLYETIVIVTRYFGGTKLGAGGLIRAYSQAVSEGIGTAGIIERAPAFEYQVTVDYPLLGTLENELRSHDQFVLSKIEYLEQVIFHVHIKISESDKFISWMTNLSNGQTKIKKTESLYLEKKVT